MMASTSTFDTTKEELSDILNRISSGEIQLPDFQRSWRWDDERIRDLLASIALSYPIGAIMIMETGNPDVSFKPRPFEGVELSSDVQPAKLVLDGQQRLTSLLLSLHSSKAVETRDSKGKAKSRHYYANIEEVVGADGNFDDAIVSLPEDKVLRNFRGEVIADYSTPENEYKESYFPLNKIFDSFDWRREYGKQWNHEPEKTKLYDEFEKRFIEQFRHYHLPIITLRKENPKEAVCQVFERVNTGGVSLTVFELLTATFAADDFNLREDWDNRKESMDVHRTIKNVGNADFLQTVSLLSTRNKREEAANSDSISSDRLPAVSCKRKDILNMKLGDYNSRADTATEGYIKAAKILHSQKIFKPEDIPYHTQLVPLAAILSVLGDESNSDGVTSKLLKWYWCGVLGEMYGSATESRFAKDVQEVLEWILDGGSEPSTISEANFFSSRLESLSTRNSAAYKGIYALLMKYEGLDFMTGNSIGDQTYFDESIDIHHIFPKAWCGANGIEYARTNCIINKTAISSTTNRKIGGSAPSSYLQTLQNSAGIDEGRMNEILASHRIDPDALRSDDFEAFFSARREELIKLVERAMGKTAIRDHEPQTTEDGAQLAGDLS